jgi:GT2 family glycosyltransferase
MVRKKIAAVTLTYGDRAKYLTQVIPSLINEGVDIIIIVSNGSERNSLIQINELMNTYSCIELIDLGKNTGSANGFSKGILYAFNEGADFIWLLDDDNQPLKGALNKLVKRWSLINPNNTKLLSLLSYRSDREIYKYAIQSNNPYLMLGPENSFLGFSLSHKLTRSLKKSPLKYNSVITEGKVAVAPYGGLFFNRKLVDDIGLPDKDFFLYADDHDFSYRITQNKGEILLILESELVDLETSFHLKKSNSLLNTRYFGTDSKDAIYYSVRNNIYFEKIFITNRTLYVFNKYVYLTILFFIMLLNPKNFWKFSFILKGIRDSKKFKKK